MTHTPDSQRTELTQLLLALLDSWRIAAIDQIALLALPADTKPRHLRRYQQNTPLPDNPETNQRAEHLIGIADALRTSYPRNPDYGAIWINRRNQRFNNRTPLATMLEDGLNGMVAVRVHVDCSWDWYMDDRDN